MQVHLNKKCSTKLGKMSWAIFKFNITCQKIYILCLVLSLCVCVLHPKRVFLVCICTFKGNTINSSERKYNMLSAKQPVNLSRLVYNHFHQKIVNYCCCCIKSTFINFFAFQQKRPVN